MRTCTTVAPPPEYSRCHVREPRTAHCRPRPCEPTHFHGPARHTLGRPLCDCYGNREGVSLAVSEKVRFSALIAFVVVLGACTEIETSPEIVDLSPRFSPDGTRLVLTSDRGGSRHLYEIDLATSEIVQISFGAGLDVDPTFVANGSIVFVHQADPANPFRLQTLAAGERREILPDGPYSAFPDVSTVGEIVFACRPADTFGLCTVRLDGTGFAVLPSDAGARDWQPVWSPDGLTIAFVSDRDGDEEIYVIDRDGTNLRQLTVNSAKDADPAWSPNGSQIAFASQRDSTDAVWIMDADGADPRRVISGTRPAWSPDGRSLAHHAVSVTGVSIAVTAIESGETRLVSD